MLWKNWAWNTISRIQGWIEDFQIEGAQKIMYAQRTSRASKREVPYGRGSGSSRVLDALSFFYLSLILKHSDTKTGKKKHSRISRTNFRGGTPVVPPLDLPSVRICCLFKTDISQDIWINIGQNYSWLLNWLNHGTLILLAQNRLIISFRYMS